MCWGGGGGGGVRGVSMNEKEREGKRKSMYHAPSGFDVSILDLSPFYCRLNKSPRYSLIL